MRNTNRRNMLRLGLASFALPGTILSLGCSSGQDDAASEAKSSADERSTGDGEVAEETATENSMQIQYLEVVTPEVDAFCETYSKVHSVTFSEADPGLGGARTAKLASGGVVGVRGPMRETEAPVVRPYVLTDDIKAAVDAAAKAGAEIAMPPTEIPGQGTFAIFIQGGIESGLWQN